MLEWLSKVNCLKGIGPAKQAWLLKLGIKTVGDLLDHFPKRYEDRRAFKPINCLTAGETETFVGTVTGVEEVRPHRGMTITKINVADDSGSAKLVWFNQAYRKKCFPRGTRLVVTGKIKFFRTVEVYEAETELLSNDDPLNTGRIVPVYPAAGNISQRFLRAAVRYALDNYRPEELIPSVIIKRYNLIGKGRALENIHFPADHELLLAARRRLVFEELYFLQCGLIYLKKAYQENFSGIKHRPDSLLLKLVEEGLPFLLTDDQRTVLKQIKADMEKSLPMRRLILGDVGSGKTVLAALALIKTVENGYQGALMAPTDILAEQHFNTLTGLLAQPGIKVGLLTGKLPAKARTETLTRLKNGSLDLVVGTHSLIQDKVEFNKLGLVVTDEQHRFGVDQRAKLAEKGKNGTAPDMLVMTATPIPRTLALTMYGDLDLSVIRQLPAGRKPIRTFVRNNERRPLVYKFVGNQVRAGRQAYIVCPLISESEPGGIIAAEELYRQLTGTIFKNIRCGLVHGKMRPQAKETVMTAFYRNEIKILIATSVIEVGVNVPNATVIVIEGADRFGLAQLHQMRGRVGRGEYQSYCILLTDSRTEATLNRLKTIEKIADGFLLAEQDLAFRGPGQFFGTKQHGLPDLKIANIFTDSAVLTEARQAAVQTAQSPDSLARVYRVINHRLNGRFDFMLND